MRSQEFELLMEALKSNQIANQEQHEAIKEMISTGNQGSRALYTAETEVLSYKVDALTKRMDKSNGTVAELVKESEARKLVVDDFHTFKGKWDGRWDDFKKKWPLFLLGVILLVVIVSFFQQIGLLEKLKGFF